VTENGVATFDDVILDWREISLVCNFDIMGVILPSDVEYLTSTFHVKALKSLTFSVCTAHVSVAFRVETTSALYMYVCILMGCDKRWSCHTCDKDAIMGEARAINLLMSDRH